MSKNELSCNAIILSVLDYKDNDAIINALSEKGKYLSFYARGIKKVTSKNAYALQAFNNSTIDYFENTKGLHLIKSAKSNINYFNKYDDYNQILIAYTLLSISKDIGSLNENDNQELYTLLKLSLIHLSEVDMNLLLSYFLVNVLDILGIKLVSEHCAICLKKSVNYISVDSGGFICKDCLSDNDKVNYNLDILKLFQYINNCDILDLKKFDFDKEDYKVLLQIIYEYYSTYSGFDIKNIESIIS